jgi:hypothetical protein
MGSRLRGNDKLREMSKFCWNNKPCRSTNFSGMANLQKWKLFKVEKCRKKSAFKDIRNILMFLFSLAFLAGDLYLQTFSQLPNTMMVGSIFAICFLLSICLQQKTRHAYLLVAAAFGFSWTFVHANSILSWSLPTAWEGEKLQMTGHIASLPVTTEDQTQFNFLAETITFNEVTYPVHVYACNAKSCCI